MRVPPVMRRRSVGWLIVATVITGCLSGPTPSPQASAATSGAPTGTIGASAPAATTTASVGPGLAADQVFARVSPSVAFVQTVIGSGSGFVIDDRYVLTNAHVVRPYRAATVVFADGTKAVDAPVVGWDLEADLVVLAVPASASRARLGDDVGPAPRTGARVYLVGYPLADLKTPSAIITEGIISGAAFEWVDGLTYHQTDAVIDYGQSGGVLVDQDGRLLGVTGGSRGQFAVALDGNDALDRAQRLLDGEDVDGIGDRVLPSPTSDGRRTIDLTLRHRADVRAWLLPGAPGDPKVHVSMTSNGDVGLYALAAAGKLGTGAGSPARKLALDVDFEAPGPFLVKVEPATNQRVKVHLRSTAGLTPFDDPDDGQALVRDRPWMGAADYAGDIDWYTLQMSAGESVTIRASAAALDPAVFVDQVGSTAAPLAGGHNAGGPLGGDDELEFRASKAGEYLVVVSDVRSTGAGAYRLTVSAG